MNTTERELQPGFKRNTMSTLRGNRVRSTVTFNPSRISNGETLVVDIPRLSEDSCIVPGSINILFKFKSGNTKSWFENNLERLLKERLEIKLAGETVYDCGGESLYRVYEDLWLTKSMRNKMIDRGLCSENMRKLMSGDDSAATSGNATIVSENLLNTVYPKLRLNIDYILQDHGLYAPFKMNNNFQYLIKLPQSEKIMIAQNGQSIGSFSLEDLEIEYETIENKEIANKIVAQYNTGLSLSYKHLTLMKNVNWLKDTTVINENINLPRKSMSAIVMLFTKADRTDSEEYVFPNINKVKVTIEGVPNSIFSQGLMKDRMYVEAKRFFCPTCEKIMADEYMTIEKFFDQYFALVIDLRTSQDQNVFGNGKRVLNTQSGILLEITKRVTTTDLKCHIFVVSDALVNFINKNLDSIQY